MGSRLSRPQPIEVQNKNALTSADLKSVAGSENSFIQIEVYPPETSQPHHVFLDTSLQKILYGDPIGEETPSSNLSTVWIVSESQICRPACASGFGPWIIRNVATSIGQAQPTQQIGPNTYAIEVWPASPHEEFLWNTEFKDGKYALYHEKPGVGKLYALPVKSDDPNLSPPRDTLIQAVLTTPSIQNVFVFKFSWVDTIKYNPALPSGINVYLRSQN